MTTWEIISHVVLVLLLRCRNIDITLRPIHLYAGCYCVPVNAGYTATRATKLYIVLYVSRMITL